MITLLTAVALAAPCLDTNLDEIIDGPTYTTSDDGTLSITIPMEDYWGSFRCGSVSLRALGAGPPASAAAWLHGAPWAGIALPDGHIPISITVARDAAKGVGVIELADGRAYRALVPGSPDHGPR